MLQFYLSMMNSGEDKALVEFLYNEYKQLMFKTAYAILRNRESAEDAVHDAFLRVINHLSKFRSYSCKENVSYRYYSEGHCTEHGFEVEQASGARRGNT